MHDGRLRKFAWFVLFYNVGVILFGSVVRATGGLADTVFDADHGEVPFDQRTGYTFHDFDVPGLESALDRAIGMWFSYPEHFRELMENDMRKDYSWGHSGQDYLNIYQHIRGG